MATDLDWDDLRIVDALAVAGSLSGAAARLKTSHTTVARRLQRLEARLGVQLFRRGEDGRYGATEAGAAAAAVAARIDDSINALSVDIAGGDVQLAGPLRVTMMDIVFVRFRAALISFQARFPEVDLTVVIGDDAASLTRRDADVALRLTSAPPETLVGRRVGRLDFALYASQALAHEVGQHAAVERYPWISWDERLGHPWLDTWLGRHAPGARVALRINAPSTMLREAVAAGFGVHFLSTEEGDADDRLVRVGPADLDLGAFSRPIWLLTLKELATNSRVRAFMDHLRGPSSSSSSSSTSDD